MPVCGSVEVTSGWHGTQVAGLDYGDGHGFDSTDFAFPKQD